METIQLNKKTSSKLRILLTLGIFILSTTLITFFIFNNYESNKGTFIIDENTIITIIVFLIVILPLIIFLLPTTSNTGSGKTAYTKKREMVSKRKRKIGHLALNSKQQGKLY